MKECNTDKKFYDSMGYILLEKPPKNLIKTFLEDGRFTQSISYQFINYVAYLDGKDMEFSTTNRSAYHDTMANFGLRIYKHKAYLLSDYDFIKDHPSEIAGEVKEVVKKVWFNWF